jgi:hypothetical protein
MTKLVIKEKIPGNKGDGFTAFRVVGVRFQDAADGFLSTFGLGILSHPTAGENAQTDGIKHQCMEVHEGPSIDSSACRDMGSKCLHHGDGKGLLLGARFLPFLPQIQPSLKDR